MTRAQAFAVDLLDGQVVVYTNIIHALVRLILWRIGADPDSTLSLWAVGLTYVISLSFVYSVAYRHALSSEETI